MIHRGPPSWADDDTQRLLRALGYAGYGWLQLKGVRRELVKLAQNWKGPAPIPS